MSESNRRHPPPPRPPPPSPRPSPYPSLCPSPYPSPCPSPCPSPINLASSNKGISTDAIDAVTSSSKEDLQNQPGYKSDQILYPRMFEFSDERTKAGSAVSNGTTTRHPSTDNSQTSSGNCARLYPEIIVETEDIDLDDSSESESSAYEYPSLYGGRCSDLGSASDLDDVSETSEESVSLCGAGRCPNCGDTIYHLTSSSTSRVACESCRKLSTTTYDEEVATSKTRVESFEDLQRADHVAWRRSAGAYWHHGIVTEVRGITGELEVINYNGDTVKKDGHYASVRREWVTCTLRKRNLYRFDYDRDRCFPPAVVLARAASRLGEAKYNPFTENCEHFARWCKTGQHRSVQVETLPQRIREVPDSLSKRISREKALDAAARTVDKGIRVGEKLVRRSARQIFGRVGSALAAKAPGVVDLVDRAADQVSEGLARVENMSNGFCSQRKALESNAFQTHETERSTIWHEIDVEADSVK